MRDAGHALRTLTLAAWTIAFATLWSTGEMARYLGPRTYWVVPFGTAALGAATVAHVALLRNRPARALTRGAAVSSAALLVPLLLLVAVPAPRLGALAASKKNVSGVAATSLVAPAPGGEISFAEIAYASESSEYAALAGVSEGLEVELTGFVTEASGELSFAVTRFEIACCAADAVPYSVGVMSGEPSPAQDTWVEVEGRLVMHEGAFVLEAGSVAEVAEPDDPYLGGS